jgi:polyphenol oxidase
MPVLFTDRAGGVSAPPYDSLNLGRRVGDDARAVAVNRRRLAELTGARPVFMRQVHGAHVATFAADTVADWSQAEALAPDERPGGVSPAADGAVTNVEGLALAVLVADCVPVVLAAPGAIGVAHAGRVGLAAGVVPAPVAALGRLGAAPDRVRAEIGPAVCGLCYEVPAAMRAEVDAQVPGTATTTRSGTPGLDLRAGVVAQLRALGVAEITVSARCTMEEPRYFSHRRDGGRTGRFAGVVWL